MATYGIMEKDEITSKLTSVGRACDACILDGKIIDAVYFCPSCNDHMCSECENCHQRVKATRFHDVVALDQINAEDYIGLTRKAKETTSEGDETVAAANAVVLPGNDASFADKSTQTGVDFIGLTTDADSSKFYRIFADKLAKLHSKVDVSHSSDEDEPFITGIYCMSNGDLCIVDKCNMTIKLLDNQLQIKDILKCKYQPYDIAKVNETEVVITVPFKKLLQFVEFKGHLQFGRKVNLSHCCYGVEVSKSNIFVVCDSNYGSGGKREIFQLTLSGHIERTIDIQEITNDTAQLHHIAINPQGDKIYLTGIQFILCMTMDGDEVYKIVESELDESEIVIDEPRSIIIDDEGNALVCCDYEKKVLLVQLDGAIQRDILTNVSLHGSPHSIAYRETDNMLFIGCENKGELLTYKLK